MSRTLKRSSSVPDLRYLQMFTAVQETGSFKEAALRLNLTISAVSQAVQALEAELGQELFDRSIRPVLLTPFGQKYKPVAEKFMQASRAYQLLCDDLKQHRQREIRIGCVDSFAATIGPALVKSMAHHGGNVVMLSGITSQMLTHLARHDVDMAICTEAPNKGVGLHVRAVCDEHWVVASPADKAWPDQLSFKNLRQLTHGIPIVRYTQRSNIGTAIDQLLSHAGVESPRRFEFDATDSLLSLVASGVGWAITSPLCLLQSEHHAKRVNISLLPPSGYRGRRFYMVYRDDVSASLVNELVSIIGQVLTSQIQRKLMDINPVLGPELLRVVD